MKQQRTTDRSYTFENQMRNDEMSVNFYSLGEKTTTKFSSCYSASPPTL